MLTPTHLIFSVTACLAVGGTHPAAIPVAAASALIPDLDSRQSIAGRLLPMVSGPLSYHVGHRTLTHSLIFQLTLSAAVWLAAGKDIAVAVAAGLVSHAFADMLTKSGVCWFWPSRVRCVLPGSARYRFETGSWAELVFACGMAALSFLLVWMHDSTQGTAGVIRAAIGDIAAARQQYDEQKGSYAFVLRLKGRDNESLSAVEGEFPVIAGWGASGFLVEREGQAAAVCAGKSCDVYPEHAVLVTREAIGATTRVIKADAIDASDLHRLVGEYSLSGDVYLSGRFTGVANLEGRTAQRKDGSVTLYYAKASVIPGEGRMRDVDLRLQVQHKAGREVPELRVPELEIDRSRISPVLEKWLR